MTIARAHLIVPSVTRWHIPGQALRPWRTPVDLLDWVLH